MAAATCDSKDVPTENDRAQSPDTVLVADVPTENDGAQSPDTVLVADVPTENDGAQSPDNVLVADVPISDPVFAVRLDRSECLKAIANITRDVTKQLTRRLWLSDEDLTDIDIDNTDVSLDDIKQRIYDKWIGKYRAYTSLAWFINALQGLGFYEEAHDLKYAHMSTQPAQDDESTGKGSDIDGPTGKGSDSDGSDPPEISTEPSTPRRSSFVRGGPEIELKPPCELFTGKQHTECYQKIGDHYRKHIEKHGKPRQLLVEILYGLGGVGKTETLCQYVWNHHDKYKGGVFVLNGQSNIYMDYGLKKLLEKVRVDFSDEELTPCHIRKEALEWLHRHDDWLLVIDNVYDPELIKMYFPEEKPLQNGHMIITSRISTGWYSWYNARKTHVDYLSPEDSAIYLLRQKLSTDDERLCSCDAADTELEKLKKESPEEFKALLWLGDEGALHGLPLALYQASRYIQLSGIPFQKYKALYFKCRLEIFQIEKTDPLEIWLKRYDLDAKLAAPLRSIVGSNALLLKTLSDNQLKDFMNDAQLDDFNKARADTDRAEFVHMVDPSKDNILTTWRMNYAQLCKDKIAKEFLHLCSCLSSRVQVALLVDGAKFLNPSDLKEHILARHKSGRDGSCTETTQRILKLFQKLQQFSFADLAVGPSEDESDKGNLNRLGVYVIPHLVKQVVFLELAGKDDKIQSINQAMSLLEKQFPNLEEVQTDKIDLLYGEAVRDHHAILAFHTLALGRQMQSLEEDDIADLNNTNRIFTSVGTYLRRLGRARDAKSLYKLMATLSKWRRPQRKERKVDLAEELRYLGKVYYELNQFSKAADHFKQSIELRKNLYGRDDIKVAYAMQGLGRVMQNDDKYMNDEDKRKEVEKLLMDTLNIKVQYFKKMDEQDHYSLAHAYHQLGRFYQDTGKFQEAHEYLLKSFDMRNRYWQRKYGTTESVDIAVGMTNLARNYLISDDANRKVDEAEEMLLKACDMKRDRMPDSSESYQLALYYLAAVYREKGEPEKSQKYLEQIQIEDYIEKYKNTDNEKRYVLVYPSEKTIWM